MTAHFADGSAAHPDLLIGCDGLRSVVRAQLVGDREPVYAGYLAYRAVTPFDSARVAAGEYGGARHPLWSCPAVLLALVALPGTFELDLDKRLDYDEGERAHSGRLTAGCTPFEAIIGAGQDEAATTEMCRNTPEAVHPGR